MSSRTCSECGSRFESKGSWQKLCWQCWRERENAKVDERAYERGFADAMRRRRRDSAVDPELLLGAIALCHPDRHPIERAELANRVTVALLDLLEATRRAA